MGKALDVDWDLLQFKYQREGLSCRELAEQFKLSIQAIQQRCWRHKWRREKQETVNKVSEIVVNRLVDDKLERLREKEILIKEHEAKAYRVSDKLISAVESNHDSMPGGLLDCTMVNTLANALKVSVGVARVSLGCVDPSQNVNVTGTVIHSHDHAISVLESCKKIVSENSEATKTIDLDNLLEVVNRK